MRWLLVSKQHSPSHGGIGTYVQRFVRAARSMNWHVELITQLGADPPILLPCDRIHEVRTIDMQPEFAARLPQLRQSHCVRPYRYALWSKAVAERLLSIKGEFDAVEFVDCQAEGFAAMGCPAVRQRSPNAAFIVHAHTPMFVEEAINGADESQFGRAIYHDWERRALTLADGVIVTGGALREGIETHCSAPPHVIPYPIDEDRPISTLPREERIILLGSVQRRKGVETWARSLSRVLRARPQATAVLVGPDTPTAPNGLSMARHVHGLIDQRVVERFKWTGPMAPERVRDLVGSSALLVVPSHLESFSFAAAEALLAGTPVIVSDHTGIAEEAPSLPRVAWNDVDAWAQAQIEALADAEGSHDTAMRCRAEMLEACAPSRVLRMREEMLRSLPVRESDDHRAAIAGRDTLVEMAEFVAGVDAMEHESAAPLASSVRA